MSTLYQKIEWVNEEDRVFRVGVWNHKRRPYFVYFREANEKNGEQEVMCDELCIFKNKCNCRSGILGMGMDDFCINISNDLKNCNFITKNQISWDRCYIIKKERGN
jgi:hypothetical protein